MADARTRLPSAGQSSYVVERALAEGKLTHADIARYLDHLPRDIHEVEERLRRLRDDTSQNPSLARDPRESSDASVVRQLAGAFGGYIRRVPLEERAHYEQIRDQRGIGPAIEALRERFRK